MATNEDECTIVLLGDHEYIVRRHWGVIPDSLETGFVSQVAVDRRGRVHLLQRAKPSVVVFEPAGAFAFAYGEAVADPHGIYCAPDDRIFITDRDSHQVIVFTADGVEVARLGARHKPRWGAPFNHPTDVAVASDGCIFVADGYGNANVHRFAADGRHELTWGHLGREPGAFMTPHAVWAVNDRVLVADRENNRVQVFSQDGVLEAIFDGLQNPMDIYVDPAGRVFVTDQVPSLTLFSLDGTRLGRCRPSLNGAHGIFGNAGGDLFLAEMNPAVLTKMERIVRTADQ